MEPRLNTGTEARRTHLDLEAVELPRVRTVAVIDVGSASIRMVIAQLNREGAAHPLESLQQPVNLGRDSFTKGEIRRSTIKQCVRVMESFRQVLKEYGVADPANIRAVATSAVREASNANELIDRVYIATGIGIEIVDDAEVNRLTYLAVEPVLRSRPQLTRDATLIVEIGGGSTELLLLRGGMMAFSGAYRFGSQRTMEMIEAYRAPARRMLAVLESQIQRTLDQVRHDVPLDGGPLRLLVMGGDARFAVSRLQPGWKGGEPAALQTEELTGFAERILDQSVDELVRQHHLSFQDAESLGPALLTLAKLAEVLSLKEVLVTAATLRDGLLTELATEHSWTDAYADQIRRAAMDLGRKFHFDEAHSAHVADLCLQIYDQTESWHGLDARNRLLLEVAALLHEVGLVISVRNHHKHSMYLIMNSELFGLGKRDLQLVALVARYHRRAAPKPTHPVYAELDRDTRIVVSKLAAILRVADSLDRMHDQHIRRLRCRREDDRLILEIADVEDLTLENMALKQKGGLFEMVYGCEVEFQTRSLTADHGSGTHGVR